MHLKNMDNDILFVKFAEVLSDIKQLEDALELVKCSVLATMSISATLRHKRNQKESIIEEMKSRGIDPDEYLKSLEQKE